MTKTEKTFSTIKLPKNNLGFLRFISLTMALLFGVVAGNCAWAQQTISTFSMGSDQQPAWEGADMFILGSNGGVDYYAQGLNNTDGNRNIRVVDGQSYYKLQKNDIEESHIKLQFAAGTIQAGDVLAITVVKIYGGTGTVGYVVGGSNASESGDLTDENVPLQITHTIASSEIIDNGDGNEYIRIARWDYTCAYGTFTVTRPDPTLYIGNADNTSGFNTAWSDVYAIEKGKVREFTFTNYRADNGNNYDSWSLGLNNANSHTDTNYFLINLTPQAWHGPTATPTYLYNQTASTVSTDWADTDWAQFRTDMNGAQVNVKISLSGNGTIVHVYATMQNNGRTYIYSYTETIAEADSVYAHFRVERSHITVPEEVADSKAYAFTPVVQIDANGLTTTLNACGNVNDVQFKDIAGNIIPAGTLLTPGEVITWTGAPTANAGFTFARWNPATSLTVNTNATVRAVFTKDAASDYNTRMFNNRITAEWNLLDDFEYAHYKNNFKFRLETSRLEETGTAWKKENTKKYSYNKDITNGELTYDTDGRLVFPLTAGLKFTAKAGDISIVLNKAGSSVENATLVLKKGVEVTIPQLVNAKGGSNDDKRDILYMITNMADHNGPLGFLGAETFGSNTYMKFDYYGGYDYTFKTTKETSIKRIIVNRNFVTSNFIEHAGQTTFSVGEQVVGQPEGGISSSSYLRDAPGAQISWVVSMPKALTMTYGGWQFGSYVDKEAKTVSDKWQDVSDFTGYSDHRIPIVSHDGFYHFSQGQYDSKSELMNYESSSFYHPNSGGQFAVPSSPQSPSANVTPWTIPCRGSYVKYEPTQPGVLTAYILQNGCLTYSGNVFTGKMSWRPHYVVDEAGALVPGVIAETSALNAQGPDYAKDYEGVHYTIDNSGLTAEQVAYLRNSSWNGQREGDREAIIQAPDGGFLAMTKAYVSYKFNVLPGKTYYIFSNISKIGIVGFVFEPGVETADGVTMSEVHYSASRSYDDALTTKYTAPSSTEKAVNITVNRSFAANKWSTICLPYSMNNVQLKEQFGDDFRVVLLRDIQQSGGPSGETKNTAHFIYHVNQDIIAGYPYLIYPSKNVTSFSSNATLKAGVNKPVVAVSGTGQSIANGNIYGNDYEGFDCFTFEGNYEKVTLPQGSYVVTKDGVLAKLSQDTDAKPFRAYLKYIGESFGSSAEIKAVDFGLDDLEEWETPVEDVLFQQGIFTQKANVYDLRGQMVRANAESIQDLPKGIYIVNGKKVMVK